MLNTKLTWGGRGGLQISHRTSVRCRASHYTGGPPRDCPHYYKTRRLSPLRDVAPRADVTRSLIGPPAASLLWRQAPPLVHPRRPLGGDPPNSCVCLYYYIIGLFQCVFVWACVFFSYCDRNNKNCLYWIWFVIRVLCYFSRVWSN